ncbi:hypothetical protein BKG96_01900 [Rodentibacter caecimuris]|uniref:NTP pyrophosphohydrolase MazG-like domain-containing protein n=1 Tax=Rodentibacter caecimuris TaxID=1796644 RepID=A0A1V3KWQ2_9PAST|nr:MazG-like family protein [Rodentibacter heylii]OOF79454.1 hypothetical protein BKG96_01900 [Rodentibacter heylii]OOF81573.1 hypothetical protein BKG97_02805 [Rodentibacter heylii]
MTLQTYQHWLVKYYKRRQWYDYNPFIRLNFLTEEVGELAQAVRAYEIGRDRADEPQLSRQARLAHIREELGDVLNNVLILADKYQLELAEIMQDNQQKLQRRLEETE